MSKLGVRENRWLERKSFLLSLSRSLSLFTVYRSKHFLTFHSISKIE